MNRQVTLSAANNKSNTTVLVVEDDKPIRSLMVGVLRKAGYNVLEANNPPEAAQMIGSDLFNIDLLVTDVVMPGMSGPEFAREMMAMRPGLKIVFATGCARESMTDADLAPHKYFLQKPYTADQLRSAVSATLSE